jgi:hypothetical protein
MYISMLNLGSLVLDINGNRLDGRFVRETGLIADSFSILKIPPAPGTVFEVTAVSVSGSEVSLSWNATSGRTYYVQRTTSLADPDWQPVSGPLPASGSTMNWSGPTAPGFSGAFYRVVCEGN